MHDTPTCSNPCECVHVPISTQRLGEMYVHTRLDDLYETRRIHLQSHMHAYSHRHLACVFYAPRRYSHLVKCRMENQPVNMNVYA